MGMRSKRGVLELAPLGSHGWLCQRICLSLASREGGWGGSEGVAKSALHGIAPFHL